jgi:hypothetical protein
MMKKKLLTLKEIHKYLIDNNYIHMSDKILIKKQILAPQESKKQTPPSLCDKPQILTDKSEIY